jgi:hypothetical protein
MKLPLQTPAVLRGAFFRQARTLGQSPNGLLPAFPCPNPDDPTLKHCGDDTGKEWCCNPHEACGLDKHQCCGR